MKIVINACYGGFNLSAKGFELFAKEKGKDVFFYSIRYERMTAEEADKEFMFFATCKDLGKKSTGEKVEKYFIDEDSDIARNDKDLVSVVEKFGKEVSGKCANLSVVEIPDDIEWVIEEYDGYESVAEKHRVWR